MPIIDLAKLRERAIERFQLHASSLHGPSHWARVEANGIELAQSSGADEWVVRVFALLHDCCRENEWTDPEHGPRASAFARQLRKTLLGGLSDTMFDALCIAMEGHDRGRTSTDPTIGTCWDADRLDLWRVGTVPDSKYMSTAAGKLACEGKRPRRI
jgi:uncharacterized protein